MSTNESLQTSRQLVEAECLPVALKKFGGVTVTLSTVVVVFIILMSDT